MIDRFEFVDLPAGPQRIPRWALDLHVCWYWGYGNWPTFLLKATAEYGDWPEQRWEKHGERYIAKHSDGRVSMHVHSGRITEQTFTRRKRTGRGIGEWTDIEYRMLATTQQDGYAGRHFDIVMGGKDRELRGKTVRLRGPWHTGVPAGYTPLTFVEWPQTRWRQVHGRTKKVPYAGIKGRPWYRQGGCFGIGVRDDVFIRIFARFQPHLRLARCHYSWGGDVLEPVHGTWPCPKRLMPSEILRRMSDDQDPWLDRDEINVVLGHLEQQGDAA